VSTGIFDLGPNTTLLPVVHGSADFALEVVRRLRPGEYDCLAVPLPPDFEDGVNAAIAHLPAVTVVTQREGSVAEEPSDFTYVPVDPCQPVIAGIREALASGTPVEYIDLGVARFEERAGVFPDPYALKEVPLRRFAAALVTGLPTPADGSQQMLRIAWMARQLRLLELEYERIVCLCAADDWPWIRAAYQQPGVAPEPDPAPWPTATYRVPQGNLFFVLGELPFITQLYEHRRAEMLPRESMAIDGVKALLLEARTKWVERRNLEHHWLTPQTLSLLLKYVRNLTLLGRRMSPDLYALALAAKQIAGDDFAVTLIGTARTYPAQSMPSDLPEAAFGVESALLPEGELLHKNRLKGVATSWKTLPLRPSPPPERKQRWRMQWDPYRQCSYPPEDDKIESLNAHVREQARRIIGQDLARTEKFTASLKDGLDMRETLRNWHTGDIYVQELPPARGSLEIVVFLFDSPADPDRYPWRTTWFAEHEDESTLCFFATNFAQNIIGPGIGQAVYGGCFLLYPPRPIPDVWGDPRFAEARTPEERLIAGALAHSRERRIVLVAPHPPLARWRRIARKCKRSILYIPLKRFSLQTLDRLRHFHVLNGREVRSYAARYIRDFR